MATVWILTAFPPTEWMLLSPEGCRVTKVVEMLGGELVAHLDGGPDRRLQGRSGGKRGARRPDP